MKKIIKSISGIITILIIFSVIDLISVYKDSKPVFIIKEEVDELNKKYVGLIFDTYNCASYSAPQIKLKWNKYSCPLNSKEDKNDNKKVANLTLVGDLLFEQPFYDAIEKGYDRNEYFSLVKSYFLEDDLSIGNMEVVIGNDNLKSSGVGYNFCAPEYIGSLVSTLDFEILGTANNHAYDRGIEGVFSTIDFFSKNTDIKIVGTYKNIEERNKNVILEINGIKFGFLNYTYGTNQKVAEEYKDFIAYYKNPYSKEITNEYKNVLKNEIKNLEKDSDVVIVLMHWGREFTYTPNNEQKEMAKFLNEIGVDIVVGSHSHSIQPLEIIGDEHKTLVYYSMGNFVSADDDIARTPLGEEEFDNAYQVGLLSNLQVVLENDNVEFKNINTELMVNYFDKNMNNFKIIPFKDYTEAYEKTHYRYEKGLTKEFINNIYTNVINEEYRK